MSEVKRLAFRLESLQSKLGRVWGGLKRLKKEIGCLHFRWAQVDATLLFLASIATRSIE